MTSRENVNMERPEWEDELLSATVHVRISARQYYGLLDLAKEKGRHYTALVRDLIDEAI